MDVPTPLLGTVIERGLAAIKVTKLASITTNPTYTAVSVPFP